MTPKEEAFWHIKFTAAHHDFSAKLNKHAYYKVSNHATGDDLVVDTFMKTWQYILRGGKIEVMEAFLYHVLDNLIVDEYRKHTTISLERLLEKGFEPTAANSRSLLELLDGKAALLLIARLPVDDQKIMRMRYVQELSLKEMALVTGHTQNALAVQLHRALKKLKVICGVSE